MLNVLLPFESNIIFHLEYEWKSVLTVAHVKAKKTK